MKEWRKLRGLNDHVHYQTILISSLERALFRDQRKEQNFYLKLFRFFLNQTM